MSFVLRAQLLFHHRYKRSIIENFIFLLPPPSQPTLYSFLLFFNQVTARYLIRQTRVVDKYLCSEQLPTSLRFPFHCTLSFPPPCYFFSSPSRPTFFFPPRRRYATTIAKYLIESTRRWTCRFEGNVTQRGLTGEMVGQRFGTKGRRSIPVRLRKKVLSASRLIFNEARTRFDTNR